MGSNLHNQFQNDVAGTANTLMTQMFCAERGINYEQLMAMAQQTKVSGILQAEQHRQMEQIVKRHYQGNSGSFMAKVRDVFSPAQTSLLSPMAAPAPMMPQQPFGMPQQFGYQQPLHPQQVAQMMNPVQQQVPVQNQYAQQPMYSPQPEQPVNADAQMVALFREFLATAATGAGVQPQHQSPQYQQEPQAQGQSFEQGAPLPNYNVPQ